MAGKKADDLAFLVDLGRMSGVWENIDKSMILIDFLGAVIGVCVRVFCMYVRRG